MCAKAVDPIAKYRFGAASACMCVHALQCVCGECVHACVRAYAGGCVSAVCLCAAKRSGPQTTYRPKSWRHPLHIPVPRSHAPLTHYHWLARICILYRKKRVRNKNHEILRVYCECMQYVLSVYLICMSMGMCVFACANACVSVSKSDRIVYDCINMRVHEIRAAVYHSHIVRVMCVHERVCAFVHRCLCVCACLCACLTTRVCVGACGLCLHLWLCLCVRLCLWLCACMCFWFCLHLCELVVYAYTFLSLSLCLWIYPWSRSHIWWMTRSSPSMSKFPGYKSRCTTPHFKCKK